MALNTVTVNWDLADLVQQGQYVIVSFTPNATLKDTVDNVIIGQVPKQVLSVNGVGSLAGIVATDNVNISPSGWAYNIVVTSSTGQQLLSFTAFIAFANGATQLLSALVPVTSVPTLGTNVILSAMGQQQLATQRSQALTPFIAGLANRQFSRCNVVCIGDSITEGQHAVLPPTGYANRWVTRLADLLRAQFPVPALTGGGRGFIGATGTGETSFTWPTVVTGSPASVTQGPKAFGLQLTSTNPGPIAFNLVGDTADIMWTRVFGAGSFSWSVDGGSSTVVSTSGTTQDGFTTRVSLGFPGAHTLSVSWSSGSSVNIDGVTEYYGDSGAGIQVHDAGHFGWQTSNWITALNNGSAGPGGALAALAPSAVIIMLGVNDQFSGVVPATFQANLQSIITSLKGVLTTPLPSFVIAMLPPRTGQAGYAFPWSQYTAAAWNVASADSSGPSGTPLVTVMDFTLGPRLPGADADTYSFWQAGDLVHPSDKGHQAIADALCRFLTQG